MQISDNTMMLSVGIFTVLLVSIIILTSNTALATTGIIIPLYVDPGKEWRSIVQAKNSHPEVPILVIVNCCNGPGSSQDSNYVTGIQNLQAADISVLGYVHTNFTARSSADVMAEIDRYKEWYSVNGIFFDQMSNIVGNEGYYSILDDYSKSQGLGLTVGNAGIDIPLGYFDAVDIVMVHDNFGLPDSMTVERWATNYDRSNISMVSYGVYPPSQTFVRDASEHIGYIYMTDDILPNPWNSLPTYFRGLVAMLDKI